MSFFKYASLKELVQDDIDAIAAALAVLKIYTGTGSPEGALAADVGSLYLRSDGGANTTLYVKETGAGNNTGWVAK